MSGRRRRFSDEFKVEADPLRWGLFIEASGILVQSPIGAIGSLPKETSDSGCNPNHLADVTRFID